MAEFAQQTKTLPLGLSATDLIRSNDGRIYHLALKAEELADNVILVGDPGRAKEIANALFTICQAYA